MQIIGSTRQKAFWNTALPDPWSTEKNKVRPSGGYGVQVLSSVHPFQGYTHLGTEMKDVYIPLLSQLHQRETNHEVGLKKNKIWFVIFPHWRYWSQYIKYHQSLSKSFNISILRITWHGVPHFWSAPRLVNGHDGNVTLCRHNVILGPFCPIRGISLRLSSWSPRRSKDFHTWGEELKKHEKAYCATAKHQWLLCSSIVSIGKTCCKNLAFVSRSYEHSCAKYVQTVRLRLAKLLQAALCSLYGHSDRCCT